MSSSKKKQNMTARQAQDAAEAKKLKRYTLTFWVVIALVVCIFIGAVAINPIKNVVYSKTDAVTVGDHTLNAVTLNYFYVDAISNYVNQYSSYISYILDTSKPLDEQVYNSSTGATWADSFLDTAKGNIKSTYALYDAAVAAGRELTEDELSSIDSQIFTATFYGVYYYGYSSLEAYLRGTYGNGADEESYREYLKVCTLANAYYTDYSDALEFTDEELDNYQKDAPYTYNSYTYASYYIAYSKFTEYGTTDEDGKTTFTDEQKEKALAAAKKAAEELADGKYKDTDEFDKAIAEFDKSVTGKDTSSAASTKAEATLYSKTNSLFRDWLTGKTLKEGVEEKDDNEDTDYDFLGREEGDVTMIEYSSGTGDDKTVYGYYVVRFESVTENKMSLKNVRHILFAFDTEDDEDPTDEQKAAAKAEAEKVLAEWEALNKKTELAFGDLANEHSDDNDGNVTDGGLYEDITPDTNYVSEFMDWVMDDNRYVGEVEIIETEYGYHIMYFCEPSETTYREYLVETALHDETLENWYNELSEAIDFTLLNDKYVLTDFVISG